MIPYLSQEGVISVVAVVHTMRFSRESRVVPSGSEVNKEGKKDSALRFIL